MLYYSYKIFGVTFCIYCSSLFLLNCFCLGSLFSGYFCFSDWPSPLMAVTLSLMLWIVCFYYYLSMYFELFLQLWLLFFILGDFFVRFCLVSFFNLCVVSINFCLVFWCVRNGGIFSFLIYFCLCCDVPLNFGFFWCCFSWKVDMLLVFLYVVGFALFQFRDPLDVVNELSETLSTWISLPFSHWWFCCLCFISLLSLFI